MDCRNIEWGNADCVCYQTCSLRTGQAASALPLPVANRLNALITGKDTGLILHSECNEAYWAYKSAPF